MAVALFFLFAGKSCLTPEAIPARKVEGFLSAAALIAGSHGTQPATISVVDARTMRLVQKVTPKTPAQRAAQIARSEAKARATGEAAIAKAQTRKGAPVGLATFTGSCFDCGKTGLLANTLCGKCKRARHARGAVVPAQSIITERRVPAAQVSVTAKAKGNQNGHCDAPSCGKFLDNLGSCKVHG